MKKNLHLSGKRAKELRQEKRLTQIELSDQIYKKTGVLIAQSTISKFETENKKTGRDEKPPIVKAEEVFAYCSFFDVSPEYLFGLTNCRYPDVNYQMISRTTGLSDSAIGTLETFRNDRFMSVIPETINTLLSSDTGLKLLLLIHEYTKGNYTHFNPDPYADPSEQKTMESIPMFNSSENVYETFNISTVSALKLQQIMELLPVLKMEMQAAAD